MRAAIAAIGFSVLGLVALPVLVVVGVVGVLFGTPSVTAAPEAVGGIPPAALAAYRAGAAWCPGLSWSVLAGIGEVESGHGQSALPGVQSGANPAGAEGPMQFEPATFAEWAARAGASPYNIDDAAIAAARMLCADGGAQAATLPQAIWDYNHSWPYVALVLQWAARYAPGP